MSKIYIGIDPGKAGALAMMLVSDDNTRNFNLFPFGEHEYKVALSTLYRQHIDCVCCLERVGAMPGQGVKSMFSFGENYGFIQGLLQAYDIPYETVPPQKWKKEFSLGKNKKASIETAKKLFPNVSLKPTERSRVDNDGMAEALLMAEYAKRRL